jgi:hypothetical protein
MIAKKTVLKSIFVAVGAIYLAPQKSQFTPIISML